MNCIFKMAMLLSKNVGIAVRASDALMHYRLVPDDALRHFSVSVISSLLSAKVSLKSH